MSITQFASPPSSTRPARRRSRILTGVVVGALVLAAVVGRRAAAEWHNRTPYPASAVAAQVSMRVIPAQQAQVRLDQLAGPGRLSAPFVSAGRSQQVVVGRLSFRTPRSGGRHGHYALFLLDKWASNRPVPMMWGIGPVGSNVGEGWDGAYDKVAHEYDWLDTVSSPRLPDGSYGEAGTAVSFTATSRGPLTFTTQLHDHVKETDDLAGRITVALVFLGNDGQVYWADRLFG